MSRTDPDTKPETGITPARDWMKELAPYYAPSHMRSAFELAITAIGFVVLWVAAWWALSISYWLSLTLSVAAGTFLLRLFVIQHDCGHGAFFRTKPLNTWVGRVLGVFTLTPYAVWQRSHALHHGTSGDLGRRGWGDIDTLTVREYLALAPVRRLAYRIYRHPLVLFGLGPTYNFLFRNRVPVGFMGSGARYWISAMTTNIALVFVVGMVIYFVGLGPFLLVHVPVVLVATTVGVWLFYVQHQFEDTYWDEGEAWSLGNAALKGSSYYLLPRAIGWIAGNINIHHVHHLNSRIPFYRLPHILRVYPELKDVRCLTIKESFGCARLGLWDEGSQKLVSFAKVHKPA